jgi:RNA polymerase sigma factor (sigma-70 family)
MRSKPTIFLKETNVPDACSRLIRERLWVEQSNKRLRNLDTSSSDAAMIRAVRALAISRADQESWGDLFRLLWPFVLATNVRRLRDFTLAEEASQEVFIRLARYCPFERFVAASEFRAYVRAVSSNVSTDVVRQTYKESQTVSTLGATVALLAESRLATIYRVEMPSTEDTIDDLKEHLGARDRELLSLLLEGRSVAEIAQRHGLSYGAIGVRLHRMRVKLRKLVKSGGF